MIDHVIDLSDAPAALRVRLEQLVIEREGQPAVTVPLADIAVVILAHPQLSCTQAVLAGLAARGAALIVCDDRRLPAGLMLPLATHFAQTERIAAQARAARPVGKRCWQQVVRAKIRAQADLLMRLRGDDYGLTGLVGAVRSGDPANVEAQAARRYWPALFADDNFRRRHEAEDQNRLLNYGYAVLRAIVGRAVCAAGLHPSLGIHHHNRYDAFCLADDLMEPYRTVVDEAVVEYTAGLGSDAPLDRAAKQALLGALTGRYASAGESRSLFDWAGRTAASLARIFMKQDDRLFYPGGLRGVST